MLELLIVVFLFCLARWPGKTDMADGWHMLQRRRASIQQRTLWPEPMQDLLDAKEWYPPVSNVLLVLVPERILLKIYRYLSQLIDLVVAIIVYITLGLFPTLIYICIPTLYTEYRNLNHRALSNLLVVCCLLSVNTYFIFGFFVYLLLMQHKMATQLILPFALVVNPLPTILALIAALLSGYKKIIIAHLDILTFWRRALKKFRAQDTIKGPIINPTVLRIKKPVTNTMYLIAHNPLILLTPWLIDFTYPIMSSFLLTIVAYSLFTTYVPSLQFLGEGFKYLKYAAFPQVFLLTQNLNPRLYPYVIIALVIVLTVVKTKTTSLYLTKTSAKIDSILAQILVENPEPKIACLPLPICAYISYKYPSTKVLNGAHGYGFKRLEGLYPVVTRHINHWIDLYDIDYLIVDKNQTKKEVYKNANCRVYRI